MDKRFTVASAIMFFCTWVPSSLAAQQEIPVVSIGAPIIEYSEPFTQIGGLEEMPGARLLVTDFRERRIGILDLENDEFRQIGRTGQGPREYERPHSIVRLGGDTLAVYDLGNRRFLRVNPDGSLGSTFPGPGVLLQGPQSQPRGTDGDGAIYYVVQNFSDMNNIPTHGTIVRWIPGQDVIDTVAPLLMRDPQGRKVLRPFISRSGWDITSEGRLAIVHGDDYRVEWLLNGETVSVGRPLNPTRKPLVQEEVEAYQRNRQSRPQGSMRFVGGEGDEHSRRAVSRLREDWEFPEELPHFVGDSVMISPTGDLWVARKTAWNDTVPVMDVFNARGEHVRQVLLPESTHLVGFGKTDVFLARRDGDDLLWLQRYAMP
jgi:hypothetical protein